MENQKTDDTLGKKMFPNGWYVYAILAIVSFILNRAFSNIWSKCAMLLVVILYATAIMISIYSENIKAVFDLSKTELLFYELIAPALITILIGTVCFTSQKDASLNLFENLIQWLSNNDNELIFFLIFSVSVCICHFIAYERTKIRDDMKAHCGIAENTEQIQKENGEKFDRISEELKELRKTVENSHQVGYTATCIPVRYNPEHESFVFVLVKNMSHGESQWMFPGSHVEVSDNKLGSSFLLTDVSITPGKVIEDKVKKEAGLKDLTFIDPYYETVSSETTVDGVQECIYPNTCYPVSAPVFNYLFRVSESANCYKTRNHRCHYDFTYIGEYKTIDEREAEYDVVEIELSRNKKIETMERSDAIAHITSKLTDQINKKINSKEGKRGRTKFNQSFDKLCLDSIPEMIYNALLFYIDYKKPALENKSA